MDELRRRLDERSNRRYSHGGELDNERLRVEEDSESKDEFANWPTIDGNYKVVEVDVKGVPYLRFGVKDIETHSRILTSFLRSKDIIWRMGTGVFCSSAPELNGERYEVFGMGSAEVDVKVRYINLYGESFGLNIKINKEWIDKNKKFFEKNGWRITCEDS